MKKGERGDDWREGPVIRWQELERASVLRDKNQWDGEVDEKRGHYKWDRFFSEIEGERLCITDRSFFLGQNKELSSFLRREIDNCKSRWIFNKVEEIQVW